MLSQITKDYHNAMVDSRGWQLHRFFNKKHSKCSMLSTQNFLKLKRKKLWENLFIQPILLSQSINSCDWKNIYAKNIHRLNLENLNLDFFHNITIHLHTWPITSTLQCYSKNTSVPENISWKYFIFKNCQLPQNLIYFP